MPFRFEDHHGEIYGLLEAEKRKKNIIDIFGDGIFSFLLGLNKEEKFYEEMFGVLYANKIKVFLLSDGMYRFDWYDSDELQTRVKRVSDLASVPDVKGIIDIIKKEAEPIDVSALSPIDTSFSAERLHESPPRSPAAGFAADDAEVAALRIELEAIKRQAEEYKSEIDQLKAAQEASQEKTDGLETQIAAANVSLQQISEQAQKTQEEVKTRIATHVGTINAQQAQIEQQRQETVLLRKIVEEQKKQIDMLETQIAAANVSLQQISEQAQTQVEVTNAAVPQPKKKFTNTPWKDIESVNDLFSKALEYFGIKIEENEDSPVRVFFDSKIRANEGSRNVGFFGGVNAETGNGHTVRVKHTAHEFCELVKKNAFTLHKGETKKTILKTHFEWMLNHNKIQVNREGTCVESGFDTFTFTRSADSTRNYIGYANGIKKLVPEAVISKKESGYMEYRANCMLLSH